MKVEQIDESEVDEKNGKGGRFAVKDKALLTRRLIVIAVLLLLLWLLIAVFQSGIADPVLEPMMPAFNAAADLINDPLGVDWGGIAMAIATVVIMHIGIICMLFDVR